MLSVHLFIQQIFRECLLYIRHYNTKTGIIIQRQREKIRKAQRKSRNHSVILPSKDTHEHLLYV